MSSTSRLIVGSRAAVFAVLSDGWLYASWVVGASRVRGVDPSWPSEGSRIHHSVGIWPMLLDDTTEVTKVVHDQLLHMRARAWPVGEAAVRVELVDSGNGALVTLHEDVVSGPGQLLPRSLRDPVLDWRNTEALRRLAYLVERHAATNA